MNINFTITPAFQPVAASTPMTDFCLSAAALRTVVDQIADRAMTGLDQITHALATVPVEVRPLLNDLRALFGLIGLEADSTAIDVGANLNEVWGVAAA